PAVATRSLIRRICGTFTSPATCAPSICQARLGAVTRFSITGPAMPKQAAFTTGSVSSPRKKVMIGASPGYSALWKLAERSNRSWPPATSNRPMLVLVPPMSPATITSLMTGLLPGLTLSACYDPPAMKTIPALLGALTTTLIMSTACKAPQSAHQGRTYTTRGQVVQLPDPAQPGSGLYLSHEAIDD